MPNNLSENCCTCDLRDLDVCTKVPGIATGIINAVSTRQILQSWRELIFTTNRIIKGSAISHIAPSSDFIIFLEGTYQIIFTSNISHTSSDESTILSTAIAINNGIILSTNVRNNVKPNEIKSIATQTIINVPQDVLINIKIINTSSVETIYTNPNITITKL